MDKWLKTSVNSHSITKTLHFIYKDRIRYNEQLSKWQYYDNLAHEWHNDSKYYIIKQYFVYESRIRILNYINDMRSEEMNTDEIMDYERLLNIANFISTHFNAIIKEAKEFFLS